MTWLSRIPVLAWLVITVALCYAIWNPSGYSISSFMMGEAGLSAKAVVLVACLGIAALYASEVWRNIKGVVVALVLLAACLWFAFDLGASLTGAQWWGQLLIGLLLTVGFQGGRLYRSVTGRVPVSDDASDHH